MDRILMFCITLTPAEAVILILALVEQSLMQILSYAGLVVSVWSMFYHWKRLDDYAVGGDFRDWRLLVHIVSAQRFACC